MKITGFPGKKTIFNNFFGLERKMYEMYGNLSSIEPDHLVHSIYTSEGQVFFLLKII